MSEREPLSFKPIDILRRELHAFCQLAQRRGWRIAPGAYGDADRKTCCPIGAAGLITRGFLYADTVTPIWGGYRRVVAFMRGFDGNYEETDPYTDLGREFRRFYCPEDT